MLAPIEITNVIGLTLTSYMKTLPLCCADPYRSDICWHCVYENATSVLCAMLTPIKVTAKPS